MKWFNDAKGFGSISSESQKGARVSFDLVDGPKGPAAENVTLLEG